MNPYTGFDLETRTLIDMLGQGLWLPAEVPAIERKIKDRIAQAEAGLSHPTATHWTMKLHRLDERLRLRWDFTSGWVVERWVHEWDAWSICGVLGHRHVPDNLLDILRAGDMQRYSSPEEFLKERRAKAEQIRQSNEKRGTDLVMSAVDKMTDRRVKEFIQVEKAIQTGETITAHGETERSLDRMRQASFRAEQTAQTSDLHDESQAINPGQHPLRQTRPTGGAHVRD